LLWNFERELSLDTLRARWREMTERNALKILSRELLANASRSAAAVAGSTAAASTRVCRLSASPTFQILSSSG
jgi:hypothetical protein